MARMTGVEVIEGLERDGLLAIIDTAAEQIAVARAEGRLVVSPYIGVGYRSVLRPGLTPRETHASACLHAHKTWRGAWACLVRREGRALAQVEGALRSLGSGGVRW